MRAGALLELGLFWWLLYLGYSWDGKESAWGGQCVESWSGVESLRSGDWSVTEETTKSDADAVDTYKCASK